MTARSALRRHDGEKLGHTCFEQSSVALSALTGCVAASSALTAVIRSEEIAIADRRFFIVRLVCIVKPTSTLTLRSKNVGVKRKTLPMGRSAGRSQKVDRRAKRDLGGPSRTARSSLIKRSVFRANLHRLHAGFGFGPGLEDAVIND
jgi:hypothetical protein